MQLDRAPLPPYLPARGGYYELGPKPGLIEQHQRAHSNALHLLTKYLTSADAPTAASSRPSDKVGKSSKPKAAKASEVGGAASVRENDFMTELGPVLARLGLSQYQDVFADEGFDTWDILLDITESDLDALGVRLGHRRKLQREIASARGVSNAQSLKPSSHNSASEDRSTEAEDQASAVRQSEEEKRAIGHSGKRKYRRHPKADENAPERPPSAYVIFSNKMREDLKGQNLSFTEIAKLVGERWQVLSPVEREPYEARAASAKARYHSELVEYKKTDHYGDYAQYLADFKAKTTIQQTEGKRPKLEAQQMTMNGSLENGDTGERSPIRATGALPIGHGRVPSISSMKSYSTASGQQSPTILHSSLSQGGMGVSALTNSMGGLGQSTPSPTSPNPRTGYREAILNPTVRTSFLSDSREHEVPPRGSAMSTGEIVQRVAAGPDVTRRSLHSPASLRREETSRSSASSSGLSGGNSSGTSGNTSASSLYPAAKPAEESNRMQMTLPALPAMGKAPVSDRFFDTQRPLRPPLSEGQPSNTQTFKMDPSSRPAGSPNSTAPSGPPLPNLHQPRTTSREKQPPLSSQTHDSYMTGFSSMSPSSQTSEVYPSSPFSVLLQAGEQLERDAERHP